MNPALQAELLLQFVTVFVVLSPFDSIPVFLASTANLTKRESVTVAIYAVAISFGILLFFIVTGDILLEALNIPMPSFQLAGSIVLFIFGLKMVLESSSNETAAPDSGATLMSRAVFPLAIPSIAGPGPIMAVVLFTDNNRFSLSEQAMTTGIVAICLALNFVVLAAAGFLNRILGKPGLEIVTRVFGLILASTAVTSMIDAIKIIFHLPV